MTQSKEENGVKLSIVSYLDKAATTTVRKLQTELAEITGSKAALLSWEPHVTVADGVEIEAKQLDTLRHELLQVTSTQPVFSLHMSRFGTFETRPLGRSETSTPYVIYLDVVLSEALQELVRRLYGVTDHYDKWYTMVKPYTPHVTLAFRDLDAEGFQKGLAYLKDKSAKLTSTIDHIALVEKREDKDVEFQRLFFGGQKQL